MKEETEETDAPAIGSTYQAIEGIFENPVKLLSFFDANINSGKVVLHPWQVESSEKLGAAKPTSFKPYKFCLCAANGSGKDAFFISPTALWMILTKVRCQVIITSSSGIQLSNQTEAYISSLAEKINNWALGTYGIPIIKIRKRKIVCLLSGSIIHLFATDEEGKAEGYHPLEPNAEMMIIVNEAKSVGPEIFRALKRCTGYNYWLNVSTPGEPIGDFYKSWEKWTENRRRVTFFDCPHQSPDEYETDKKELGEHDPLFRSKWLALFTFVGGKSVVNQMALERMRQKNFLNQIKWIHQNKELRIGIDIALSKHGDESIISAFRGNKQTHLIGHRIKDATVLADNIEKDLTEKVKVKRDQKIFIDDGNVGRAVADILRRKGWSNIIRVLNQSPPFNKKQFRNRGAELWYKFSKLIEYNCLILLDDAKLYSQIASRKYKESDAGIDRLTLQAKSEMISEGLPSPDRADASVLAFTDTNVNDFIDIFERTEDAEVKAERLTEEDQLRQLISDMNKRPGFGVRHKNAHYSLHKILRADRPHKQLAAKYL